MTVYRDINVRSMLEDLQTHVIEVIFDKLDGTQRSMRCTLIKSLMPEQRDPVKIQQFHEQNKAQLTGGDPKVDVITVWDLDAHGWRSIRTDRIVSAQMTNVN